MKELIHFLGENIQLIYILILSIFVGIEVIGRVPSVLHTPLMSGANAIHGVVIVGAIIVMLDTEESNIFCLGTGLFSRCAGYAKCGGRLCCYRPYARNV